MVAAFRDRIPHRGEFRLFDGTQVLGLLTDYLDGVAPPIPSLDLPFEPSGAINRFDRQTGILWASVVGGAGFTPRVFSIGQISPLTGNVVFVGNTVAGLDALAIAGPPSGVPALTLPGLLAAALLLGCSALLCLRRYA